MNTRDNLKEYILRRLGAPLVDIKVTSDQMDDIIADTIKEFTEFAYSGELVEYIQINCAGRGEYTTSSKIQAITKVSKGSSTSMFGTPPGAGYVADSYTDMITNSMGDAVGLLVQLSSNNALIQKYMGDEINYSYNSYKRKFYVHENYVGPLVLEAAVEYIPEDEDDIFNATWVKAMSVARTRLMQSEVTGMYSGSLIGGTTINYDKMESLALKEIDELKEELLSKYGGPAPMGIA